MKTLLPLLLLSSAPLFAEAPTAEPVQIVATDHVPADVPFDVKPMNGNEEGVTVTYLVTGENLSAFKPHSLVIESVSAEFPAKLPANFAKRCKPNDFFQKITEDGTYGRFTVLLPFEHGSSVRGLKFKGTITAYGDGTVVTAGPVTPPEKAGTKIDCGPFKVSRSAKSSSGSINVTVEGPLDQIKELIVTVGGLRAKPQGWSGSENYKSYDFRAPGEGAVRVQIDTWSNRKEIAIPFSFGT